MTVCSVLLMLDRLPFFYPSMLRVRTPFSKSVKSLSIWAKVPQGPPDAILGVTEAFKADSNPNKINLGVGAYRDDNNKPFVLHSVRKAEIAVASHQMDKEYSGITGDADFQSLAAKLAYGDDSVVIKEKRVILVFNLACYLSNNFWHRCSSGWRRIRFSVLQPQKNLRSYAYMGKS